MSETTCAYVTCVCCVGAHKEAPEVVPEHNAARGVRVALVAYASALEDALRNGTPIAELLSWGIPSADIEKVRLAGSTGVVT